MIKRFIRRVFGLPSEALLRMPRERHGLARGAISPAAAKVCTVLREAGFSGYVVGGAVRDLLLGIVPKDFDIATDAHPEQVEPLFRRALLIARRAVPPDAAPRAPIAEMAPLLDRVPPARLFDEMLKLLLSGHASACLRQLREVGLHKGVLPLLDVILEQPLGERFVTLALAQTDERVLAERPVSPAFLFAALLWHEVLAAWKARQARGERAIPALEAAMDDVLDTQCAKLAITRKLTATMREGWAMQPRFEQRSGQRVYRLFGAPPLRLASG